MKRSLKTLISVFVVILFACSSSKLLTPTQADADRMSSQFPDITLAQLTEGKSLFQSKCTTCHPAKNPKNWSPEEWNKIVPGMVSKANKKEKKISDGEKDLIIKYVLAACKPKG